MDIFQDIQTLLSLAPLGFFWGSCCCSGCDPEYWVTGGFDSSSAATDAHTGYDPGTDTWCSKDVLPSPKRYFLAGGSISSLLHATGGFTTAGQSDNDQYDPTSENWTSKTALIAARYQHSGSGYDDKVFVTAGRLTGGTLTRNHEEYDVSGDSWTTLDVTPSPARAEATIAEDSGFLFLMAGLNSLGSGLINNDGYDYIADTWDAYANLPTPARWGCYGGGSIDGYCYIQGGGGTGTFADLDQYDPSGDSWTSLTSGRSHLWHVIKEVGSILYATTGGTNTSVANIIQKHDSYDPGTDSWTALTDISALGAFHSAVNSIG